MLDFLPGWAIAGVATALVLVLIGIAVLDGRKKNKP